MSNAIDFHGTLVARAPASTPTTFTTIAELRGITPPPLSRNSFDVTPQNDGIDAWVPGGVMRRGNFTFGMNFLPADTTQDHLAGVLKSFRDKAKDGWRITFPDTAVSTWIFSGAVVNFAPAEAPVEGGVINMVTIRPTGPMSITGTAIL